MISYLLQKGPEKRNDRSKITSISEPLSVWPVDWVLQRRLGVLRRDYTFITIEKNNKMKNRGTEDLSTCY